SILESLATLSDAFASVAPEQQRLLENATDTGAAFLRSKDEFTRTIRAADEVLAGLGDEPAELRRLFVQNDRLARAGLRLIARNGDDLHAGIDALGDFVDFQLEEREAILDSLTYVPQFLHAIEDASVPWRDPDGDEYYRIRVGLIIDNVESTWPCKYELPRGYDPIEFHRFPHEREPRRPLTLPDLGCPRDTASAAAASTQDGDGSLIEALRVLLAEARGRANEKLKTREDIDWGDVWPDQPPRPDEPTEPEPEPEPSTEPSEEPEPSPSPS
ncbi:MAG: hypothetical protein M3174_06555, partial [Actinomycetota bacterium]|nr:hypothetical protein [Actinomycetota bacterium]